MPCRACPALLQRASGQVLVALAFAFLIASSASGAVLPPSPNPLPGSAFQGADGNQDDATGLVDWQALEVAGRVRHNPDPNAADTAFTNSKENEPGRWAFADPPVAGGVIPGKSNILDAWSAYDVEGTTAFLYLAFTRASATGTTFITFELNHDSRLWNNGRAVIPCRRTGDLLVTYEAQGNHVSVILQQWVTSQNDPGTGCATTGRLDDVTGLTPNVDAQGAVNNASIVAHLPGFYSGSVPLERFGEAALNLTQILEDALGDHCFSFGSIWMHSRASNSDSSNMEDYVGPREVAVRTCSASGTKFHDLNANGRRDASEPGLPRWEIWADYDDDGIRDGIEPFAITDSEGQYVINDIRSPDGTYMLRETLLTTRARRRAGIGRVTCSYPTDATQGGTGSAPGGMFHCAWGPIDTATTTDALDRDFGNYQAALLVVRKELEPSGDPGRFDLFVNRRLVLPAAGDGASRLLMLRPGRYVVAEVAAAGTNALDYESTVECKRGVRRRQLRSGTTYESLQLLAGERSVCTFRNVRPGVPAIDIDKTGPATARAGDTLHYTLFVTNPGDLPFPEASVRVTDPNCDEPPRLIGKADSSGSDDSPGTLDPRDTWTYACSRKTMAGPNCAATVVPNTATVTGTTGGVSVNDQVTIETKLTCPPTPPEPTPPEPLPPNPIVPPGPKPPDADDAGRAGVAFVKAVKACISNRVPRVNFEGTRIARIQVFVNGRLRRRLTMAALQTRVTPRVRLRPGRYRVAVRVTFQRGTGSPPVTLTGRIRICAVRAVPRFTG